MALSNETIQNKLIEKFGDQVLNFSTASGILSFESSKEINLKVLQYLYEEPSLGWAGFGEVVLFVAFFLVGFIYIIKKGALQWED